MPTTGRQQLVTGGIIAMTCVGMTVTAALLGDHDGGWAMEGNAGTGFLLQLCSSPLLPSASCADVVGSRWGSFDFYLGDRRLLVPTSFLGFGYFLALTIWMLFCGLPPTYARWRRRGLALFVGTGLIISIALTAVMGLSLQQWCPLCMIAHAANLGIAALWFGWWWSERRRHDDREVVVPTTPHPLELRLALLGVATTIVAIGASWVYFDTTLETRRQWRRATGLKNAIDAMQDDTDFTMREFFAEPVQSIPLKTHDARDDRPTMVVFRSFTSDANACFEQEWREDYAARTGQSLRIEYRHTPVALIESMTAGRVPSDAETTLCRAAEAARLQNLPRAYYRFTGHLFSKGHRHGPADLERLSARCGLDAERLLRDMESNAVRQTVVDDLALGAALGIDHTPAIFIEGRRVPHLCVKSPVFWSAIGHEPGLTESLASIDRTWIDREPTASVERTK